jgi:hypothetical protein
VIRSLIHVVPGEELAYLRIYSSVEKSCVMCDDSGLVGNEASNVEVGEYDTEMRTTKKLADHVLIE